jgi:NAD(P)-dependent dehydrogenase (short-subunit alcohol dehydrogenase family)
MHKGQSKEFFKTLQPMGRVSDVKDIVDAIVYLTEADQVTGEVLHATAALTLANGSLASEQVPGQQTQH